MNTNNNHKIMSSYKRPTVHCDVCNITISNSTYYENHHIKSKKHLKNIEQNIIQLNTPIDTIPILKEIHDNSNITELIQTLFITFQNQIEQVIKTNNENTLILKNEIKILKEQLQSTPSTKTYKVKPLKKMNRPKPKDVYKTNDEEEKKKKI